MLWVIFFKRWDTAPVRKKQTAKNRYWNVPPPKYDVEEEMTRV
jgi:hypothetical protein